MHTYVSACVHAQPTFGYCLFEQLVVHSALFYHIVAQTTMEPINNLHFIMIQSPFNHHEASLTTS